MRAAGKTSAAGNPLEPAAGSGARRWLATWLLPRVACRQVVYPGDDDVPAGSPQRAGEVAGGLAAMARVGGVEHDGLAVEGQPGSWADLPVEPCATAGSVDDRYEGCPSIMRSTRTSKTSFPSS
jgi:hypothetical protein